MAEQAQQAQKNNNNNNNNNDNTSMSDEVLKKMRESFSSNRSYRVLQNALVTTGLAGVAFNHELRSLDHTMSHIVDQGWTATNQKSSGRCWIFAGLNLFKAKAMKAMNLKNFEFSQNYVFFWNKFETANYFLEAVIETAKLDIDDRTVAFLMDRPTEDGGQWDMFADVVRKYGIVPKIIMPESYASSNTRTMNSQLKYQLRQGAVSLRKLVADDAKPEVVAKEKLRIMDIVFRMLCLHLGTPPTEFEWQWNDKDNKFHSDGVMTPVQFREKYMSTLNDYVCVVNDPRSSSPFHRSFTVKYLGSIVGSKVKYLNVTVPEMKEMAMKMLKNEELVWFGCDCGKMMDRKKGLWHKDTFELEGVYDTEFKLSKEERLLYHHSVMSHAMVFTGVDIKKGEDGKENPSKWRVENSWGTDRGTKGFYVMDDSWFAEYMFEIAAHKSVIPEKLLKDFESDTPIELPPWDPMGSLAL